MLTFTDLVFHTSAGGGVQRARIFFPNGYGVSVITGETAYSDPGHPYELAVLKGNEDDWNLCYDTDITDDVIGYQTAESITQLMMRVQQL